MEKKKDWVDFKAVKGAVTMQMVLDRYGITGLKKKGAELRGPCPVHKGSSPNFSVNLDKNAFQCFSSRCKARGNVLDFVAAIEGCSVRDAAINLAVWFGVGESERPAPERPAGKLTRLHQLTAELEEHLEKSKQHLAQAETIRAAIQELVAEFDQGG